jgi:hypothetical protein
LERAWRGYLEAHPERAAQGPAQSLSEVPAEVRERVISANHPRTAAEIQKLEKRILSAIDEAKEKRR